MGAFAGLLETFRRDLGIGGPCSSNPLVRGLSADCGVTPQKVVRTNPTHQKSETTTATPLKKWPLKKWSKTAKIWYKMVKIVSKFSQKNAALEDLFKANY